MDCNRPPGFVEVISFGGNDDEGGSPSNNAPHLGTTNEHQVFRNIEGAKIMFEELNGAVAQEPKSSTVGGIVRGPSGYFVMTVAHTLPGYHLDVFRDEAAAAEFEYQLDGWSDDEEDDEEEVDKMSKASMSPPNSDSDDSKSDEPKPHSTKLVNSFQSNDSSSGVYENINDTQAYPISRTSSFPSDTDEVFQDILKLSIHPESSNAPTSLKPTSKLAINAALEYSVVIQLRDGKQERLPSKLQWFLSDDESSPENSVLDYALFEIPESQLVAWTGGDLDDIEEHIEESPSQTEGKCLRQTTNSKIVCSTTSGGSIPGELLASPTFLKAASGLTYQEIWTIHLQGPLAKGDSGSWVRDATTGNVYGHVIAGSLKADFAYIIPMCSVIEDLEKRIGGKWGPVVWMTKQWSFAHQPILRDGTMYVLISKFLTRGS
jgi:hypothetical protein